MGAFAGSITFKRYRVLGELPDNYRNTFFESIEKTAHREIDIASEEDRTVGWVCVGDILDTTFTMEKVFVGSTVSLTLRVDTLKVPGPALKLYLRRAEREFLEATRREKVTKRDREEIKERVLKALRKRVLPSMKGIDMVWDVPTGTVRLWTHNKGVTEAFEELFWETFGMRLLPRTPYTAMGDFGYEDETLDRALDLEPADFVGIDDAARKSRVAA